MHEILNVIQERHSARVPFDSAHPVAKQDLDQILEAGRWAPTAHNMQNFEILIVDDKDCLEALGNIRTRVSHTFIRENYQQLSFSEEELLRKKVGLLASQFPLTWRTPRLALDKVGDAETRPLLKNTIQGSPVLLIAIYDTGKRTPASEGDVLGITSLGCVMENMWLMAQSLGIGFQVMSVFSADPWRIR